MTIPEFKAWLEGFEAAMGDSPTKEQWEAIKAKIAQLRAVDVAPLPSGYKWRHPWWEVPLVRYEDDRTVPLRTH
ncbi:hypothetical protein [Aquamicrobium soli]|uniref:Uncharacterized protein n=1 Tax=Aquamicrobium soli TaxID=1811518 RepID=A0ABV7KBA4_9HYPH